MPKVLIDMPDSFIKEHIESYEPGSLVDIAVRNALKHGIVLDGLTNGEVIQNIFPGAKFCCTERLQTAGLPRRDADFDLDFWNAKWGDKND